MEVPTLCLGFPDNINQYRNRQKSNGIQVEVNLHGTEEPKLLDEGRGPETPGARR